MTTTTNIWGTFELDDSTGLPVLPEGYFWQVRGPNDSIPFLFYVKIQKLGTWGFTKEVASQPGRVDKMSESEILEIACYTLLHCNPFQPKETRIRQDLIGDYPPKKLR